MAETTMLGTTLWLPWIAALAVPFLGRGTLARGATLATMLAILWLVAKLFLAFDGTSGLAQFGVHLPFIPALGSTLAFALDGYNVFLALLTALLFPVVLACAWRTDEAARPLYLALLLLLEAALLGTFLAQDLLVFFVLWEAVLIPMVLLILVFGGAQRRQAAISFFLYTMAGSIVLLAAVIYLGAQASAQLGHWSFAYSSLETLQLDGGQQTFVFLAVVLACAVKSPLFPFHAWLPLAYREASPSGTALMAGVLSKMGAYGFLRLALPLAPDAAAYFAPLLIGWAVVSIVYGAVLALRQRHYKLLVAYASLSHMGYIVLGAFSLQPTGLHGAMVQILSHGVVVAGLFLLLGLLEQRRGSAYLQLHGLATRAPRFAVVTMLFVLASLALPLTSGFAAEFLVLIGAFNAGLAHWHAGAGAGMLVAALVAATGVVLGATYMLRFARTLLFDDSSLPERLDRDLTTRELAALAPLLLLVFWIGVRPAAWMNATEATVGQLARPGIATMVGAQHDE
jgi:proton-translocating NADH-quinone oxidoreductase, chain M